MMVIKKHVKERGKRISRKYPFLVEYAEKKGISASYMRMIITGVKKNDALLNEYRKYAAIRKIQEGIK